MSKFNGASSSSSSSSLSALPPPAAAASCYSSQHLAWLLPYVLATIAVMHLSYLALYHIYENGYTAAVGLPPMSAQACAQDESNDKCGRSDHFAFQVVSGVTFLVIGGWAFRDWHLQGPGSLKKTIPNTAMGRLYSHHPSAQWITVINLSYQIWDFAVSLTIPEFCTAIMMSHHAAAGVVAWSGIYNDMLSYYALFFLGASEISSIWLVSLDIGKYFELPTDGVVRIFLHHVTGPLFAGTFLYYRVILWWPCSMQLLKDVREVLGTGKAQEARPGRTWILYMWLTLNFPLGLLQLYWLSLIMEEAHTVVAAM